MIIKCKSLKKNPEFVIMWLYTISSSNTLIYSQLCEKHSPGASLRAGLWEHNRKQASGALALPAPAFQWELQKGHCHLYVRSATFPDHVLGEAGPWGDRNSFPTPATLSFYQTPSNHAHWLLRPPLISLSSPESRFGCFLQGPPTS